MKEFNRLLEISDKLLGPNGCPWDREQTLLSLQTYLLEESHELIEAIDSGDSQEILGELGDLFYVLIFIAKLGAQAGKFTIADSLQAVAEKMIRRHPHVFGEVEVSSAEDVMKNWEEIKKLEKAQAHRKKTFDGIPPTLPVLAKAQKMVKILRKTGALEKSELSDIETAEEVGERLWQLITAAEFKGIDVESALRRKCQIVGGIA